MRALFLSHNRSDSPDAYNYRLRTLCTLMCERGFASEMRYLGDPPLGRPTILHPLKINRVSGIDRAEVLHAGSAAVAFSTAFLPNNSRAKIVFDMHGDTVAEHALAMRGGFDPAGYLRVRQEIGREKRGLKGAHRLVVVSGPLREHAIELGFPKERISIVRNGVDLKKFVPAGDVPARKVPLIVYAGRFDRWQGVEILIRLSAAAGDRFKLRIVGFSEDDGEIRNRLLPFAGDGVELVERVGQEELLDLLREGDALLIPRESHPATEVAMPTKFAEYLALGRPILLTRVGEPAEMVERTRCGITTEPDAEGVLDGIARLADLGADERRQMGCEARRLAEDVFDWAKIGDGYASLLNSLTDE